MEEPPVPAALVQAAEGVKADWGQTGANLAAARALNQVRLRYMKLADRMALRLDSSAVWT